MVLVIFGLPDTNVPVWDVIPRCSVMINALKRIRAKIPHTVSIWVDSGGFQILAKGLQVDILSLLQTYRDIDADFYISLDIPPQRLGEFSKELIITNLRNFEYLYERLEGKLIVPVVHASLHPEAIIEFIDSIKSYGCKYLACGGAVPLIMSRWGQGTKLYALMAMTLVRRLFSGWIHALGVGGSNVMKALIAAVGFNSFDSSAWRIKAAYGKVIVPGVGERYVGDRGVRFGRTRLSKEELSLLVTFLRNTNFPYVNEVDKLLQTFTGRAIINAWVLAYSRPDDPRSYSRSRFRWLFERLSEIKGLSLEELRSAMAKIAESHRNTTERLVNLNRRG